MFVAILVLVALQGLWYAASFQPSLFDEQKHFAKTVIHSESISPFLGDQKPEWDITGTVFRDGAYMFYFIMGKALNVVSVFTDSTELQLFVLRMICLAFFIGGFIVLKKVLLKTDIKGVTPAVVHIAFLFMALTPAVAPLFGALSYDSLSFLCISIALLMSINIIKTKKLSGPLFLYFAALCIFTVLVKWTNIALIVPIVIFVLFSILWGRNIKTVFEDFLHSFRSGAKYKSVLAIVVFVSGILLFIERPVMNTLEYGSPEPNCGKVMSEERCLKFPDYAIYAQVSANKPKDFSPVRIQEYFFSYWAPRMINTQATLSPWAPSRLSPSLPFMSSAYFLFAVLGTFVILMYLREFLRDRATKLLLFATVAYSGILLVYLYGLYVDYAIPAAVSGRYLLPVLPIFIFFSALAFKRLLERRQAATLSMLFVTLLLFTQGGGVTSYLLTAPKTLYWKNDTVRAINNDAQSILRPVVNE